MHELVVLRRLCRELQNDYDVLAEHQSKFRRQCLEIVQAYEKSHGQNADLRSVVGTMISDSVGTVTASHRVTDTVESLIYDHIRSQEKTLLDQSYNTWKYKHNRTWFLNNLKNYPNDRVFDQGGLDFVRERLNVFEYFKLEALDIGSGLGDWYDYLAGFSPVHMCDINWALFDKIKPKYHQLFWDKERIKFVKGTGYNLPGIPSETIGFVFSWNTFNFLPVEIISKYLNSCYDVMLPGAHAMISYTNAEREDVHSFIESEIWCYNTCDRMVELVRSQGFIPMAVFESELRGSWIEFKKPGRHPDITVEYSNIDNTYCKKVF